jgi:diaminohydroxyphosphoribosylaminopyrimidine deaminase/5-amino-6-(5-phosphoribosylamino)uracil reductase
LILLLVRKAGIWDLGLEISDFDARMMRRALSLAARGRGQVSPSPLVGCVITEAGGSVVGEGYYLYERVKHAETLALEEAGTKAMGATAYVSLEPHAHQGRTPPCTDALIRAGVRRVVAPIEDPNPKVSGKGFAHLRAAGLRVETGLLAHEAARLNEKYIHFMRHARPFVHLKLASSLDGRIATHTGDSRWITGEEARARVHELRHEYDAILIGSGTAIADNPLLTDRSGKPRRLPLTRVLLDPRLRLSPDSQLALSAHDAPVLLFTSESAPASAVEALERRGIQVLRAGDGRNPNDVLMQLGNRSIQSVLVEGGANVAGAFLDARLVDKVSFFIAPMIIGGCDAPPAVGGTGARNISEAVRLSEVEHKQHGPDIEVTGYPMRDEG